MKDFNKPLRKAIYELLNNQLTYNNASVKVFDEKVKKSQDSDIYVIIGNISSDNNSTFNTWSRNMDVVLDVVTKTGDTVSRKMADDISGQILELMMPTPENNGLTQANFQYLSCQLGSDRYLDLQLTQTQAMVRRLLTFSIIVNQTN